MTRELGDLRYTFAVIADTHLNQGEDECNSPFEVNRLANARLRYVVDDLNSRDVEFVIHLGDIVHPVPAVPNLYERATACFKEQIANLEHKLYYVPGNHDVGDKPFGAAPVGTVRDEYLELWREHFGEQYYSFVHDDCVFIVINAQTINTGLKTEQEQRDWLEGLLEQHSGQRIFLSTHYPPYMTYQDEAEHYDNIAEPGRTWLLELLNRHNVEALFAGHVHNFWYHRHGSTDFYLLPSTAFVRQDYSEMYRIDAGAEAGRNDAPKLGYILVHVHENGHVCEPVRTLGHQMSPSDSPKNEAEVIRPIHPALNDRAHFGFDMRQEWLDITQIPPSGGLDEFDRKPVRNDYPVMALWEMGVRQLRIPVMDLAEESNRDRLKALRDHGLRFTVFAFGEHVEQAWKNIAASADIIDALEIVTSFDAFRETLDEIATLTPKLELPVYYSKLRSKADLQSDGEVYYHFITHGFTTAEQDQIEEVTKHPLVQGAVFRISPTACPWDEIEAANEICKNLGIRGSMHLQMGTTSPAEAQEDEERATVRIAEALAASLLSETLTVYSDTFADFDRGYFPRLGVVDRRFNPRIGHGVVRTLYGIINHADDPVTAAGIHRQEESIQISLSAAKTSYLVVCPSAPSNTISLPGTASETLNGNVAVLDCRTGRISKDGLSVAKNGDQLKFSQPISSPVVLLAS